MTVAVTGGSGVVGSAVVRHLVGRGDRVRALSRSRRSADVVSALGAEPVVGDVLHHGGLVDAFAGCDVVYHVAGINELCTKDPHHMHRVNVDGTRTVLRACAAAGVRRLVHTSSAVTVGEPAGVVASESTRHRGSHLSAYERTKHHAEQVVMGEKTTVEVVSVNPSSVQGPGRAGGTGAIVLDVLRGRLKMLVDAPVSVVDIDDCARGHLLAAEHGRPGERYLLSGFTTTVSEAVDMAARALGRSVDVRFVPMAPVRAAVWAMSAVGAVIRWDPPYCPEMMRVAAHGHRYDGSKATRELGLVYTEPAETIGRLVGWFRSEGLLT